MNLANLLNDGKLKKSFMVATLVSTVLGTFSTALTAHDRVMEKRAQAKQKKLDAGQDEKLQNLESQVKQLQSGQNGGGGSTAGRSARPRARRRSTGDDDSDDFDRQARRSMAVIGREYEDNVRRLGSRFAEGDSTTEVQLQKQIIALQQSVIDVLQDALINGRTLNNADVRRLIAAQDRARDGSLDALRSQYDRMLQSPGGREPLMLEPQRAGPMQRQLTMPNPNSPVEDDFPPPRRVRTLPAFSGNSASAQELFCRYSLDLQQNFRKDLHPIFAPISTQRCPACELRIPVTADKFWQLENNEGRFTVDSRFVIKCHTPQGDFACVLCYNDRERDADYVCSNYGTLIQHIGTMHAADEFEREVDIYRS